MLQGRGRHSNNVTPELLGWDGIPPLMFKVPLHPQHTLPLRVVGCCTQVNLSVVTAAAIRRVS